MNQSSTHLRILLATTIALSVTACGGGGGGLPAGVVNNGGGGAQNDDNGGPTIINAGVVSGACRAILKDVLDLALEKITLPDLGPGCDYYVEGSQGISADLIVNPGVAFLMDDGASLTLSGTSSELNGTATQPIVFQGVNNVPGSWEGVAVTGRSATFNSVSANYISINGASGIGRQSAALDIKSAELSLTNSTVANSRDNAVSISSFDSTIASFQSNRFIGNQGFPLVLEYIGQASGLNSSSDFTGVGNPNSRSEVLIESTSNFSGRISSDSVILKDIGTAYLFRSSLDVENKGLVLEAGVELLFAADQGLTTDAALYVFGEQDKPVTFGLEPGASGDWKGLDLNGTVVMNHFQVNDGGSGQGSPGGSISIPRALGSSGLNAILRLSNGVIDSSRGFGIFCASDFAVEDNDIALIDVSIQNSLAADIHPSCGELRSVVANAPPAVGNNPSPLSITDPLSECKQVLIGERFRDPMIFSNEAAACDVYLLGNTTFSSTVFIGEGTTFIMAPEASVSFGGTLTAVGSQQKTIKFLGENDVPGDWRGITISESLAGRVSFVDIYNAGVFSPSTTRTRRTVNQNGAALTLSGNAPEGQGLQVTDITVSRSAGHGVYLSSRLSTLGAFNNNVFLDNALPDLAIHAEHIDLLDDTNEYSASLQTISEPVIEIKDSTTGRSGFRFDKSVTLKPLGGPWLIPDAAFLSRNDTLTIESGTELHFGINGRLSITGDLQVSGAADNPVIFKGQQKNDNKWGGVEITGSATIAHADLFGGGIGERGGLAFGNGLSVGINSAIDGTVQISFPDAPVLISDITIQDSYGFAIKCAGTDAGNFLLTRPGFDNNESGDVDPDCGI